MTVSKTAEKSAEKASDATKGRKDAAEGLPEALQLGELSEQLGYVLKRAQLKVFENFLRCMASLQLHAGAVLGAAAGREEPRP